MEKVFVHGFLHSDPHAANAFVRPVQIGGRSLPQLVLLDHGLYRELSPAFRENYGRLWRALVLRNTADIEFYARALGAGDYYKIFSFILVMEFFFFPNSLLKLFFERLGGLFRQQKLV